ncbi:hypothetical protein O6H91_12G079800 [Diphasiastrum complanatum]|uniref:Uncharacterized protein n=1 Tax=Diphasiastrum complanatum TaxID=34168 RepID=A0ACC2C3Z9_DIPCM|nr:hypothetical protein O6H91_12G079800 [Diphasiastrum complanatum]
MGLHRQGGGAMPPVSNGDHKVCGSLRSAATAHRINDYVSIDQEDSGLFRPCQGERETSSSTEFFDDQTDLHSIHQQTERKRLRGEDQIDAGSEGKGESLSRLVNKDLKNNYGTNEINEDRVHFGQTVDQNEGHRDSRYWDSDDRKREIADSNFGENEALRLSQGKVMENGRSGSIRSRLDTLNWDLDDRLREKSSTRFDAGFDLPRSGNGHGEWSKASGKSQSEYSETENQEGLVKSGAEDIILNSKEDFMEKLNESEDHINIFEAEDDTFKNPGLYNERGRKELKIYEQRFEAGLNLSLNESTMNQNRVDGADGESVVEDDGYEDADEDDEGETVSRATDDRKRFLNDEYLHLEEDSTDDKQGEQRKHGHDVGQIGVPNDLKTKREVNAMQSLSANTSNQFRRLVNEGAAPNTTSDIASERNDEIDGMRKPISQNSSFQSGTQHFNFIREVNFSPSFQAPLNRSTLEPKISQGRKRRKHSGTACKIDFLNSIKGLKEPDLSERFLNFTLNYVDREERPLEDSEWEPRFSGHQTLLEREGSFYASNKTIHCGFVQGPTGSSSTGFDLSQIDTKYLSTCHIAVSSCIFGNSDYIRSPDHKKLLTSSRERVCFVMFVDQKSLDAMMNEGQVFDESGYVGLWKVVLVKNLPFSDDRRNGKVPKFLTHRLFPSARYSIWIDSKLRLLSDPLLILEHFLWRKRHEYAISNHYDRHCVSEEVQQNKRLNKFNHSVIDEQYAFYQQDGLTKFNISDPNRLLPSYVPEGSFIIRAHTPMSNLFSCLWFNEVDRFTPRDQLSFAYTYLKLVRTNSGKHFFLHMFKDCERKAMAKLFRHKQEKPL